MWLSGIQIIFRWAIYWVRTRESVALELIISLVQRVKNSTFSLLHFPFSSLLGLLSLSKGKKDSQYCCLIFTKTQKRCTFPFPPHFSSLYSNILKPRNTCILTLCNSLCEIIASSNKLTASGPTLLISTPEWADFAICLLSLQNLFLGDGNLPSG